MTMLPVIIEVRINGRWFPVEGATRQGARRYKKNPPYINDDYDAWRAVVKATKKVLWTVEG